MKKFAIISISIVLLVSVVCVAAFAFWDTTTGEISFTGSKIGSKITLTSNIATNDGAGAGKKLVSNDAVLGDNEAKLVSLGAVDIKIESDYTPDELQGLVKSIKFNVSAFSVASVAAVSNTTYQSTFDLYLTTDNAGGGTKITEGADFIDNFKTNFKNGYKMYAFLKYKDGVNVDGASFAKKNISIKIQFVIA